MGMWGPPCFEPPQGPGRQFWAPTSARSPWNRESTTGSPALSRPGPVSQAQADSGQCEYGEGGQKVSTSVRGGQEGFLGRFLSCPYKCHCFPGHSAFSSCPILPGFPAFTALFILPL